MLALSYQLYLALGDSMSIDDFAGPGLGAAALLFANDERYPEFAGRDLRSACPECRFVSLARNGFRTRQILKSLEQAPTETGPTLVTLTAGGNDLLAAAGSRKFPEPWLEHFVAEYDELLLAIKARYPDLTLLAGNIYDPTDGTGFVQSGHDEWAHLFGFLATLNTRIFERLELVGAVPIDIHSAFFGRASAEVDPLIFYNIEPTKLGSSEIRRLFWQAIGLGEGG